MWNFGDGGTAEGDAVLHHFSYPGRYAVVLTIAEEKNSASDELVVTAEPAALRFSLRSDGGIEIRDLAGHDLDLSGWIVRENEATFAAQFMLPDHSEILSDSSMSIAAQTLSFHASSSTLLEYPNGVFALSIGGTSAASSSANVTAANAQPITTPAIPRSVKAPVVRVEDTEEATQTGAVGTDPPVETGADAQDLSQSSSTEVPSVAAASASQSTYLWWIGVAGIALAAGAAILAAGYIKRSEWDIVEDKDD